ncbi:hypothetical protein TOC8172_47450 [Pseudomonas syringae]
MPFGTLGVLFATQSVATCIPTRSVGNDNLNYLNYRATLCVACRSGRSASSFTTQSVATCIPTLERRER